MAGFEVITEDDGRIGQLRYPQGCDKRRNVQVKTVFIFGAGASKPAGAPLMSDFLDQARSLYDHNEVKDSKVREAFSDVFEAMGELRTVYDKSHLEIDNIETLFGAIEMGVLINKFGERKPADITRLRESIITLIVNTLELTIKFPVENDHIYPCQPYDKFVEMITSIRQNPLNSDMTFSFITFNYDLALDYALQHQASINWDYKLSKNGSSGYSYLKLHGSINWGFCQECNTIISQSQKVAGGSPEVTSVLWRPGSSMNKNRHCNKLLAGPVLVPPTWNKMDHQKDLIRVWRKASEDLGSANNIFIIGYSMPETDSFFRYLFALGSDSKTRLERFWVFNPDPDGTVRARFDTLKGVGVHSRFKFFEGSRGSITEAIPRIQSEFV